MDLIYKTKSFCFGKRVKDSFSHLEYVGVRESVRT